MNELELLEYILEDSKKNAYSTAKEFTALSNRAEILVRKFFGDNSHYLQDLKNIRYQPSITSDATTSDEWKSSFEAGVKQFNNVLSMMLDERKSSSNYDNPKTQQFVDVSSKPLEIKTAKEIKVVIASPGDVLIERELLMDKLETRFRRGFFEERCGARIIVNGWENVASQSGYPQDVINETLIKKADIIIAVFRHKLGSPTIDVQNGGERRADSGTAEEILYAIKNKSVANPPLGMAYFYGIAPVMSLDSIEFDKTKLEWDRLKEFKTSIKDSILYKQYNFENEIIDMVCNDLCANILHHFPNAH